MNENDNEYSLNPESQQDPSPVNQQYSAPMNQQYSTPMNQPYPNQMCQPLYTQEPVDPEVQKANFKAGKKAYNSISWRLALYGFIGLALQFIYIFAMKSIFGSNIDEKPWFTWLELIVPFYLVAFPLIILISFRMPKTQIEKHSMGFGKFILCIFMCAGICAVGTVIGAIISSICSIPANLLSESTDALTDLLLNSDPVSRILTVGILAPIVEELIFRKFLVDRVIKYGELPAILSSGIMFGLFHGNFSQAFFATGLGIFFAYIYARTGKVWYTIFLHMTVNLTTSIFTIFFIKNIDLEKMEQLAQYTAYSAEAEKLSLELLPSLLGLCAWLCFLGACALTGIILFICFRKKFFTKRQECEVENGKRFSLTFGNFGMICFLVYCLLLFANTYIFPIIINRG